VFRKTFRLSSVHNKGAGSVTTLVATDCSKLYDGGARFSGCLWPLPAPAAQESSLLLLLPLHYTPTSSPRVHAGVQHVHHVWTAPLETLAIIALLLSITNGIYGLPALWIVVLALPLQCAWRFDCCPLAKKVYQGL